jgi:hypothetical protein
MDLHLKLQTKASDQIIFFGLPGSDAGFARFFLVQNTKTGKNTYTKLQQTIPNVHKI